MKTLCAVMVVVVLALAAVCLRSESQKAGLRSSVGSLEADRTRLADECDALRQKLATQKTSLEFLAKEKAYLKASISRLTQERDILQQEGDSLKKRRESLWKETSDLKFRASRLYYEKARLTDQWRNLKQELEMRTEEYEAVDKRYRDLEWRYHRYCGHPPVFPEDSGKNGEAGVENKENR